MTKQYSFDGFDMSQADMPVDSGSLGLDKVATVIKTAALSLPKVVKMAKERYEIQDGKQGKHNPMGAARRYAAMAVTSALIEMAETDDDIHVFLNDVRAHKAKEQQTFWQMVDEVEGLDV